MVIICGKNVEPDIRTLVEGDFSFQDCEVL